VALDGWLPEIPFLRPHLVLMHVLEEPEFGGCAFRLVPVRVRQLILHLQLERRGWEWVGATTRLEGLQDVHASVLVLVGVDKDRRKVGWLKPLFTSTRI
jgi:hypothetical protein